MKRRIIEFYNYIFSGDKSAPIKRTGVETEGEYIGSLLYIMFWASPSEPTLEGVREMIDYFREKFGKYGLTLLNNPSSIKLTDVIYISVGDLFVLTGIINEGVFSISVPTGYYMAKGDYRKENIRIAKDEAAICKYIEDHGFSFEGSDDRDILLRQKVLYNKNIN